MRKLAVPFAISALALLPSIISAATIDNTQPRRDVAGELMDVHDGNVIKGKLLTHVLFWTWSCMLIL